MTALSRRRALTAAAALGASAVAGKAFAQQTVTLRLHQFLPPSATIPARAIVPWAQKLEAESGGRLKLQLFHSMSMGGSPPQLFDQARDGVVDMVWTVLGYTPGRFNKAEVFELPFMSGKAEPASRAFHEFVQTHAADEFRQVHLLAAHTHGPGLFHSKFPISGLDSLKGKKVRGGSRVINNMLLKLGATPVGMPVPAVTEALTKGVLDATTIPWEVTPSLKIADLVKHHTTFAGPTGLFTQTFALVMNRNSYDKLPADLKAVLDKNSGVEAAAFFGRAMDEGDKAGLEVAQKAGNSIVTLNAAETQRWKSTAAAVEADWIKEVKAKGIDGAKLVADARALIAKHTG
ncbi:TRAP transporter substrate-binding protein [Hydrogenophaga crocea]|jgi:TRAP-type transport system periplasmic protein|uniref:TRAP transporter substrate-binding protein n=1 Tax=Hydrogenophaga crocea TaxID=2716225 RepID=A0A6G8IDV9_9BURK|nr:TRAP transporter substrate-binding protein [Hydrogenophaga crocea]QIM51245.1 TRAP transporter substrate-binding protein [Hydrogenophaga crocea]